MNWSRTKNIFIFVFLVLNVFLGYQLLEKQTNKLELAYVYDSSIEELLLLRNIAIEADLDLEQPDMSQLHVQFNQADVQLQMHRRTGNEPVLHDHILRAELSDPYPLGGQVESTQFEEDFFKKYIYHADQYAFDQMRAESINYVQMYKDFPLFVGRLILHLNQERQIDEFEQVYYEVRNQGSAQPVLSAYHAIRTVLDNQAIPSGATIMNVWLGYYGQIYEVESQVLTPTWRIIYEYEDEWHIVYVNGFTGAIDTITT